MSRKVINRKNIVIVNSFPAISGHRFSKNIHLSFQPDTMVVKLISVLGNQDPTQRVGDIFLLYCSNINEYLGSFWDGSTSTPNLTFDVRNATFNTEWTFESHSSEETPEIVSAASIAVHLEFLKHED